MYACRHGARCRLTGGCAHTVITGRLPVGINGLARVVTAAGGVRYVRIVLKLPNPNECLIETLGHELRHATEFAGMPEVRNEATLAVAYRRVGVAMAGEGNFETDAAVKTGQQVARELAAAKKPR